MVLIQCSSASENYLIRKLRYNAVIDTAPKQSVITNFQCTMYTNEKERHSQKQTQPVEKAVTVGNGMPTFGMAVVRAVGTAVERAVGRVAGKVATSGGGGITGIIEPLSITGFDETTGTAR